MQWVEDIPTTSRGKGVYTVSESRIRNAAHRLATAYVAVTYSPDYRWPEGNTTTLISEEKRTTVTEAHSAMFTHQRKPLSDNGHGV